MGRYEIYNSKLKIGESMELREYLKVFGKYWIFIIITAVLGAVLAVFFKQQLPTGYKNSQTFYLMPQTSFDTSTEAFYVQEKARNFTDSAVAIIESPDFKFQIIFEKNQALTVRKLAPQVLQINTFSQKPENSRELMEKTVEIFNERFDQDLQEIGPSQNPSLTSQSKIIYTAAGFVAGLAFAIFAVSLKTYFRI